MKSINVKKVAAVAAGTAMLVGAAFAATMPGLEKSFFWKESGDPAVNIVLGHTALPSDGIAAANLAAAIGGKAYTAAGTTTIAGADIGADCSVTVATEGGTTSSGDGDSLKVKIYNNDDAIYEANSDGVWTLTKANAPFLKTGTLSFTSGTDYSYQEIIELGSSSVTFDVKYQEDDDQHGVFLTPDADDIHYYVNFDTAVPDQASISGAPKIWFLGEEYIVNKFDVDGGDIELIKGEEVRMATDESHDITVGDALYTVTLDDASLNEASSIGEASLTVTKPDGSTSTVTLDTSSDTDETVNDLYVYLESVAKSYTLGQGGTATLRLGGEKLELETGNTIDGYEVDFTLDTDGDAIEKLSLKLDTAITLDDGKSAIYGPNDYFVVKYTGTSAETKDVLEVTTSNHRLHQFTYVDSEGTTNTVEIQDSADRAKTLFSEEINATDGPGNMTMPIKKGFSFIVGDEVIKYQAADATPSSSWAAADTSVTLKVYGEDAVKYTPDGYDINKTVAYFKDVSIAGTTIDFMLVLNDTDASSANSVAYAQTYSKYGLMTGEVDLLNLTDFYRDGDLLVDTDGNNLITNKTYLTTRYGGKIRVDPNQAVLLPPSDGYVYHMIGINSDLEIQESATGATGTGSLNITALNVSSNEGLVVNYDTSVAAVAAGNLTAAYGTNSADNNNANGWTAWGTNIECTTSKCTLTIPDAPLYLNVFAGQESGTTTAAGETAYDFATWAADDTVTAFACSAQDYTYESGLTVGSVGTVVVGDSAVPVGNYIVIGGHLVNDLSIGKTTELAAAGDTVLKQDGSAIYAAGWTAADTTTAVNDLIDSINAL